MSSRNATASWSGYLHQGKIGILVGLRKLNKLLSKGDDLAGWIIEYESAEDIDIKYQGKVISRHQVKANKNAKYPNAYVDVLSTQSYVMKDGKKVIDTKGFQIRQFNESAIPQEEEVEECARFLHTITETNGFYLEKIQFNEKFPSANYVPNPNNIQLYVYPDGKNFCELYSSGDDKVLIFCKDEIKKILSTIEGHPFANSGEEHENIFKQLVGILDLEIRNKHYMGEDFFPTLYLDEIYEIITSKDKYIQSHTQFMREKYGEAWTEYIYELQDNGVHYEEGQIDVANEEIKKLFRLDDDSFVQFMKDINPDKRNVKDLSSISDVVDLCDVNAFKDVFYECLVNVTETKFDFSYNGYEESGGYLLTLINRPPSKVRTVIKNMMSNKEITDAIFNRRYLINDRINNVSFGNFIQQNSDSLKNGSVWSRRVSENDIFYNTELEFISLDKAIEQLNGKEELKNE